MVREDKRSHYEEDRGYLAAYLAERTAAIEQELRDLARIRTQLANLPEVTLADMDCPVCGAHAVRDLRPLYELGRYPHAHYGGWLIDPARRSYGDLYSQPDTLECSVCHGFRVLPPKRTPTMVWTPDFVTDRSTGLAAILMREFPHIEEVAWFCTPSEWHARIGLDQWWCYTGYKNDILHNLMLHRRPRRRSA